MKTIKHINTKKMIIATLVITTIASTSVSAYEHGNEQPLTLENQQNVATKNENIGFGTGALIGGIVAGPIGAFVAGMGGVFLAKYINVNDENDALTLVLTEKTQSNQRINTQLQNQYQARVEQLENTYQRQLMKLENQYKNASIKPVEQLLMSLQFSTGSSDIAHHYQEQVVALANILINSPTMKVDLSGYTDLTGAASLNQTLSQARVESVKKLLLAQGVKPEQIATYAFGEVAPVVANNEREVSFYDRRVVVKLHQEEQLSSNQMVNNH
ncbi:hypothetical protein NBRC116592_33910 [Colwellia sp. KU-HH00111]|uniref:sortase-associated OmpA-like protein PdsO n=1 Tax=Colwellia sp. KU-HH00111 TaxID=3127652 RepID=UPI0031099FF5